jgi:drug/metabolite transporter superfamily protein YnfA
VSKQTALIILVFAAILEAGGDALVRAGIQAPRSLTRALFFAAGAIVLFAYGWTVNAPPWSFGRLLGIYIVLFFVVSQVLSWLVFHESPNRTMLVGGTLILAGGVVLALGNA